MDDVIGETVRCPECGKGTMTCVSADYAVRLRNNELITIPNVVQWKCDAGDCGMFSSASVETIENAIKAKYPNYYQRTRREDSHVEP